MGRGKKKGGAAAKKRAVAAAALAQEEAREELLALEAIFGEDLSVHDGGSLGFNLRVVPHPGEAAANHVSLTLVVGCAAGRRCSCMPDACLPSRDRIGVACSHAPTCTPSSSSQLP